MISLYFHCLHDYTKKLVQKKLRTNKIYNDKKVAIFLLIVEQLMIKKSVSQFL